MIDPLAEVVALLRLNARYSKRVSCRGAWRVERSEVAQPFFCAVLAGRCQLTLAGQAPLLLETDDFVLVPAASDFSMCSVPPPDPSLPSNLPTLQADGSFQLGDPKLPAEVHAVLGHGASASPDASLLVSLLPHLLHVRGDPRLATLVQWVRDESRAQRPAREEVLTRLMELMFIEALRSTGTRTSPGLLKGLADARLAQALRALHAEPQNRWTVSALAQIAAMSRSAFLERFSREVGQTPMAYLLNWRMALAKQLLSSQKESVSRIAERVGYGSASAFSSAFTRHVGQPPARYAHTLVD